MYALISPLEVVSTGYRVAQVAATPFDVCAPFFWESCPEYVQPDVWFYELVGGVVEWKQTPPPTTPANQNKVKAERLLAETDWVNQPDVIDPNVNPHLLNHADFITYRAALRTIAVNPQPGVLVWPTKPQEQWS